MSDLSNETTEAQEAEVMGEKPDLGRKSDALIEALSGTDSGSDTRAGSLQGGSASGSDDDPDQDAVNAALISEGMQSADAGEEPPESGLDTVNNTGDDVDAEAGDRGEHKDADAATG